MQPENPIGVIETATAVRSGQSTARGQVEAALRRLAAAQPHLHAFEQVRAEAALSEADLIDDGGPGSDGPLAGVPVAVKAESAVAGLVTTYGGRGNTTPAVADSEAVRRLRAAGAVVLGTTAMPEFGQFPFTESSAHGAVRNPWRLDRSTGGSSGGSAAAVAAGVIPLATGGDGGGSLRIPAACCGLVGVKPMRGRVSTAPHPALWGTLGTVGGLTRSAADAALLYDVLRGTVATDRFHAPQPAEPFTDRVARGPGRLRIGWLTRSSLPPVRTDPEVAAAVREIAGLLVDLGHDVVEINERWPDVTASFTPQFYAAVRECMGLVEHPDRLEWRTLSTARTGVWARGPALRAALALGERLTHRIGDDWAAYDMILSPTIASRTPALGRLDGVGSTHALVRAVPMVAFTVLANVTGWPAVSFPAGADSDGLPIGAQLSTVRHDEGALLAVVADVERARPWPLTAPLGDLTS